MAIYADELFQKFTPEIPANYGYFFPFSYIFRESVWTQQQVDETFGSLITGIKVKWALFGILLGSGLIFLGLSIFTGIKSL